MKNVNKYIFRTFIFFLVFLLYKTSFSQPNGKKYTFSEINWTIILPHDFKIIDSAGNDNLTKKGKKAMESSSGKKADISATKTLISATKNTNNYFSATLTPFDTSVDGDWKAASEAEKKILYKTFKDKMPTARIDTASTKSKIDGLDFDKLHLKITVQEKVLFNMYLYSKLYKGYDFGISYLYLDDQTKVQIETMLKNSKFIK